MIVRELIAKLGFAVDGNSVRKAQGALDAVKKGAAQAAGAVSRPVGAGELVEGVEGATGALAALRAAAAATVAAFAFGKAVSAIRSLVGEIARTTEELDKQSALTGESTEVVQRWAHIARLGGASLSDVTGAIGSLGSKLQAASLGSAGAVMSLSRLGVAARDSTGKLKPPSLILEQLADRVRKLGPGIQTTAKVTAVLGQSGANLIPTLLKGSAAIREAGREVEAFGATFSPRDREAANDYRDGIARVGLVVQGLKGAFGGPLLRIIADVTKQFTDWVKLQQGAARKGLTEGAQQFHKLAGLILRALKGIFKVTTFIAKHWDLVLIGLFALAATSLGFLVVKLVAAGAAGAASGLATAAAWALAFIKFIAIAALIALAILLIEDFIVFLKGGDSLIGRLIPKVNELINDFIRRRGTDPWWLALLREIVRIFADDIPEAIRSFVEVARGLLDNFFKWVDENAETLRRLWETTKDVATVVGKIAKKAVDPFGFQSKFEELQARQNAERFGATVGTDENDPRQSGIRRGAGTVNTTNTFNINADGLKGDELNRFIEERQRAIQLEAITQANP